MEVQGPQPEHGRESQLISGVYVGIMTPWPAVAPTRRSRQKTALTLTASLVGDFDLYIVPSLFSGSYHGLSCILVVWRGSMLATH